MKTELTHDNDRQTTPQDDSFQLRERISPKLLTLLQKNYDIESEDVSDFTGLLVSLMVAAPGSATHTAAFEELVNSKLYLDWPSDSWMFTRAVLGLSKTQSDELRGKTQQETRSAVAKDRSGDSGSEQERPPRRGTPSLDD